MNIIIMIHRRILLSPGVRNFFFFYKITKIQFYPEYGGSACHIAILMFLLLSQKAGIYVYTLILEYYTFLFITSEIRQGCVQSSVISILIL